MCESFEWRELFEKDYRSVLGTLNGGSGGD